MKGKKKIILVVFITILFVYCGFRIFLFSKGLGIQNAYNLFLFSELIRMYEGIEFDYDDSLACNEYPYHIYVQRDQADNIEKISITIRNLDSIQYSQICEVVNATREYVKTDEDFPYVIHFQFNPVGSGEPYGIMWNYNSSEDEFYSGGMDWIIRGCNISVENCTELYEEYSLFVGYENVYIEDVSDYEVLTNWEGLECLKINCGNTPEEIELYNEALREMFPDGSVYIQTR